MTSSTERQRWEERHGRSLAEMSLDPSSLLLDFSAWLRDVPKGRALDLACGNGRNAFLLASLGYPVTAIDYSAPAVEFVAHQAIEMGVTVEAVQADLTDFDLGTHQFAVIASFFYLDRNLIPRLVRSMVPGGVVFFETYTVAEREVLGRDIRRDYCLEVNEALHLFAPLTILYYREDIVRATKDAEPHAVAQLIARRTGPAIATPRSLENVAG